MLELAQLLLRPILSLCPENAQHQNANARSHQCA